MYPQADVLDKPIKERRRSQWCDSLTAFNYELVVPQYRLQHVSNFSIFAVRGCFVSLPRSWSFFEKEVVIPEDMRKKLKTGQEVELTLTSKVSVN